MRGGGGADWARERGREGEKKSEPVTLPCLYQTGEGPGSDFLVLTLLDMIRGACRGESAGGGRKGGSNGQCGDSNDKCGSMTSSGVLSFYLIN